MSRKDNADDDDSICEFDDQLERNNVKHSTTYYNDPEINKLNDLTLPDDFIMDYVSVTEPISNIPEKLTAEKMLEQINAIRSDAKLYYDQMLVTNITKNDRNYKYFDNLFIEILTKLDNIPCTEIHSVRDKRRTVLNETLGYIKELTSRSLKNEDIKINNNLNKKDKEAEENLLEQIQAILSEAETYYKNMLKNLTEQNFTYFKNFFVERLSKLDKVPCNDFESVRSKQKEADIQINKYINYMNSKRRDEKLNDRNQAVLDKFMHAIRTYAKIRTVFEPRTIDNEYIILNNRITISYDELKHTFSSLNYDDINKSKKIKIYIRNIENRNKYCNII